MKIGVDIDNVLSNFNEVLLNDYVERLIELFIEGIGKVIDKNNREVENDKEQEVFARGYR